MVIILAIRYAIHLVNPVQEYILLSSKANTIDDLLSFNYYVAIIFLEEHNRCYSGES